MRRGERVSTVVPVVAAAGLVLLIAVASHARSGVHGDGPSPAAALTLVNVEAAVFTVLLVVGAVLLVIALSSRYRLKPDVSQAVRPRSKLHLLLPIGGLLIAFVLVAILRHIDQHDRHRVAPLGGISGAADTAARSPAEPSSWAFIGGAVAGIALAVWLVMQARAGRAELEVDVASTTDAGGDAERERSLDELRAMADHRAAVVLAYAELDRLLRRFDQGRRSFEAPLEHAARVSTDLGAQAPAVWTLARRYEQARYSDAVITESAHEEAVAALAELRLGLGQDVPA